MPTLFADQDFNADWKFARGAQAGAEAVNFDDASWTAVRLPHDWAISGPYEPEGDGHTGKLPWRGEGWYRKTFSLPAGDAGKRVYLDFDGVMAMPMVYVNGRKAGRLGLRLHVVPRGRDGFREVRPVERRRGPRGHAAAQLAVVSGGGDLPEGPARRQRSGHIAQWGTYVTTPAVTDSRHRAGADHGREPPSKVRRPSSWNSVLLDPAGKQVAQAAGDRHISREAARYEFDQAFRVTKPQLWDVKTPRLYKLVSRVLVAGKLVDVTETPFGIRTFEFTAE